MINPNEMLYKCNYKKDREIFDKDYHFESYTRELKNYYRLFFDIKNKRLGFTSDGGKNFASIDMELLNAIYYKCKELKMMEE